MRSRGAPEICARMVTHRVGCRAPAATSSWSSGQVKRNSRLQSLTTALETLVNWWSTMNRAVLLAGIGGMSSICRIGLSVSGGRLFSFVFGLFFFFLVLLCVFVLFLV